MILNYGSIQYGIYVEYLTNLMYTLSCCIPTGLPTLYFAFHPKHFLKTLKDMPNICFCDFNSYTFKPAYTAAFYILLFGLYFYFVPL